MEPFNPGSARSLKDLGHELHEETVVLELEVFDAKSSIILWEAHVFLSDEAGCPRTFFFGLPKERSANSIKLRDDPHREAEDRYEVRGKRIERRREMSEPCSSG